jgi:hypothetical protein
MNGVSRELDGSSPRTVPSIKRGVAAPDPAQVDRSVRRLATTTANALIIGEAAPIIHVLNIVWPTLSKPVFHSEGRRLILPVGREGTLVIRNAQQLSGPDQDRLLAWWDPAAQKTRVIACASSQLLASVESGGFSQPLFDRFRDAQMVLI